MSISIFGTDGVRGKPGEYPLDEQSISRLGSATVRSLGKKKPTLLVARDTRESGPWIERHLLSGVVAEGGTLVSVGVNPTPVAAFLSALPQFDGGFMISASHNPYPDNGIKILTGDGTKASAGLENRIIEIVGDLNSQPNIASNEVLETCDLTEIYEEYARNVIGSMDTLHGSRIAVDCANGATSKLAPDFLRQLGFDVIALNVDPNGRNINEGCGSTDPENLCVAVRERLCRIGIAFDGDGDRAILVDNEGNVVDGDGVLFVCAMHLASQGKLSKNAIVATVMSNVGLEVALRSAGIDVVRCPVGDRHVFEEMRRKEIVLGGEQSGHIIFSDRLGTGDGLGTALSVLRVMAETGQELSTLTTALESYPQVLINVPVRKKPALETESTIVNLISRAEQVLGPDGRVLVRYSGTEPLLRVMIEGPNQSIVEQLAQEISSQARFRLGFTSD